MTVKLCECGCGRPAPISKINRPGYKKGEPQRFVRGHRRMMNESERFWQYVAKSGPDECWPWTAGRSTSRRNLFPYGTFRRVDGSTERAHRTAYRLTHGEIPVGLVIDHLCRNTLCVNPAHLQAVPRAVNNRRGDGTKLSLADVREIRSSPLSNRQLARIYNVHPSMIWGIRSGRFWNDEHAEFLEAAS